MTPARGQPAGDPDAVLGLGAGLHPLVRIANGRDLGTVGKSMREGLDALLAQTLQLLAPLGEQVALGLGLGHPARNPTRLRSS